MSDNHHQSSDGVTPMQLKRHIGKTIRYSTLLRYLIRYYRVEQGYGVAFYLGYPDYLDNHLAVANWLHEKLRKPGVALQPIRLLKQSLHELLPEQFIKE